MEQQLLTLTDRALSEVRGIMADKQMETMALRVGVKAGGCSGMSYQLHFDHESTEQDHAFEVGGVRVLVDQKSASYLSGMTLDFSKDLVGGGFKFLNPNAKRSCGCGESFSA